MIKQLGESCLDGPARVKNVVYENDGGAVNVVRNNGCLLYTSDAADD
jgi:hypothetical protein